MIKKINKFYNKQIRELIYFVTSKCPLRCAHCFYNNELNRNIKELTLEEIEKVSKKLPYLESLQLSGGEPFLRPDLDKLIGIFVKNGVKHVGIPTNGFFKKQTLDITKKIKKFDVDLSISISIDGFKDQHNKIRGRDCFDKAIETFKALKKEGIKTGFSASLSRLNYESYIKLIKYLQEFNPDFINVIIVRAKPDIMISSEQFMKIRPELERLTLKYMNKFYRKRQKLLNDVYQKVLNGKILPFRCLAGRIIAVLEPDGYVRSCELRSKLGNVRDYDYSIKKILKLDNIPKNCTCIHSCFIGPSMSYSLKWMTKNVLFQFA